MRQSSNTTSPVREARIPSLSSFLPADKPGVPLGTMNDAWPRWPSAGSTVATTTLTSAMPPFEMKILVPLMTQSSPSRLAVVRSALTSEPAPASPAAFAGGASLFAARAGPRLRHAVGAELDLVPGPEALRDPVGHLLGG